MERVQKNSFTKTTTHSVYRGSKLLKGKISRYTYLNTYLPIYNISLFTTSHSSFYGLPKAVEYYLDI